MLILVTGLVASAALIFYLGLAFCQSWERADVSYTLRKAYEEGRKKLILGS